MKGYYSDPAKVKLLKELSIKYRGCKFLLNGKTPQGFSCSGLQIFLHKETGAVSEDVNEPYATGNFCAAQRGIRGVSKYLKALPHRFQEVEELQQGDLITFKMKGHGEYHIGTYLGHTESGKHTVVHAAPRRGVSLSDMDNPLFGDNILAIWRILGDE